MSRVRVLECLSIVVQALLLAECELVDLSCHCHLLLPARKRVVALPQLTFFTSNPFNHPIITLRAFSSGRAYAYIHLYSIAQYVTGLCVACLISDLGLTKSVLSSQHRNRSSTSTVHTYAYNAPSHTRQHTQETHNTFVAPHSRSPAPSS